VDVRQALAERIREAGGSTLAMGATLDGGGRAG